MMRKFLFTSVFCACATVASAQVFEVSVSGGVSRFGNATLVANDPSLGNLTLSNGFRMGVRMTFNTQRFFGHEVGFGYAHSNIDINGPSGQGSVATGVYSGFYDFLAYATPEGSRVRPFACGGVEFSSFRPPGGSVYYNVNKFGINYGAGLKVKISGPFGARVDFRQYNTGKPDLFQTSVAPSGRLKQTEITIGLSYSM